MRKRTTFVMLAIGCWLGGAAAAQDEASDLAKAAQNPLASMVSLPLQFNYNGGVGPFDRTLFNLNVQPVVPFPGEKWNVIARAILPVNPFRLPAGEPPARLLRELGASRGLRRQPVQVPDQLPVPHQEPMTGQP